LSGLPTGRFCFEAFLPFDNKERRLILEELKPETRTIILYEAPHRLAKTLSELYEALGERDVSVCRELTKRHETLFRGKFPEVIAHYTKEPARGECVIVIKGADAEQMLEERQHGFLEMDLKEHMSLYTDQGMDQKEAMKQVAKDRGVSKRDIYQELLRNNN
jgi:16S rRNA (cytidine1402-2'-O)-methyltransferase